MTNLWIDVKIPYEPNNRLADAYNRAMESTTAEWVLLLDHDLFFCNPNWYNMCLDAIKKLRDKKVGWITAKCNRIASIPQKQHHVDINNNDVFYHIDIARRIYNENKGEVEQTLHALSGFFILTNKTAWKAVGGFKHMNKKIYGIDNEYERCLSARGFGLYVMNDLYFYHLHRQKQEVFKGF